MSYWTQSSYAVLGDIRTLNRIRQAFRDAEQDTKLSNRINPLNTFLVKIGYASRKDIHKLLSESSRQIPAGRLFNSYAEFSEVTLQFGPDGKTGVLRFTVDAKWLFDNTDKAIRESFPDVQVFGSFWDESAVYDTGTDEDGNLYREYTDDVEGIVFKRFTLRVDDRWGSPVREIHTNDFDEFAGELERLCGSRPASDKDKDIMPVVEGRDDVRYSVLEPIRTQPTDENH